MNKDRLKKCIEYRVRLRPPAFSVYRGQITDQRDDIWMVEKVKDDGIVAIRNQVTAHAVQLGADHIHHFDSDPQSETDGFKHGFLILTVNIFLSGANAWIEPIPRPNAG